MSPVRRRLSAGLLLATGFLLVRSSAGCSVVLGTSDYDTGSCSSSASGLDASKRDRMVKACMLLNGCYPYLPFQRVSDCVTYDTPERYTYYSASLAAKSCADIEATRGIGWARPGECATTTTASSCKGSRAINCQSGVNNGIVRDCAIMGGTCTTYTWTDGKTYAGCQVATGSCSDTTEACESNMYYQCSGGKKIGLDCNKINSTCETRSGDTSCWFNSPKCSGDTLVCEGDVAVQCSGGQETRYDCSAAGLTCKDTGTSVYCLAPSCTTDVADACEESCDDDGEHANICIGGSPFKVDCVGLGFKRCASYKANDTIKQPFILCQNL